MPANNTFLLRLVLIECLLLVALAVLGPQVLGDAAAGPALAWLLALIVAALLAMVTAALAWRRWRALERLVTKVERAADALTRERPGMALPAVGDPLTDRLIVAFNGMVRRLAEHPSAPSGVSADAEPHPVTTTERNAHPRHLPEPPDDDLADRVARCAAGALPVLLAEDSRPNQLVATTLLAKVGLRVDVVENGLQAVAAVSRRNYALVLMDLAMPDMDGIEATGCIRSLPGKRGRVPIVAMTANAFDEDRQRCLDAGMDGYLSKPIDRQALFAALLRWVDSRETGSASAAGAPAAAVQSAQPQPVAAAAGHIDPALAQDGLPVLDEQVAGALARDLTDALMPEVVATFIAEVRERIAAVQQAAAAGDSARAGEQAHALKGSAATFGATALQARALSIEQAGRAGSLEAVRAQVNGLGACGEAVIALLAVRWGGAGRGQRGHGGVPC